MTLLEFIEPCEAQAVLCGLTAGMLDLVQASQQSDAGVVMEDKYFMGSFFLNFMTCPADFYRAAVDQLGLRGFAGVVDPMLVKAGIFGDTYGFGQGAEVVEPPSVDLPRVAKVHIIAGASMTLRKSGDGWGKRDSPGCWTWEH